MLYVSDHGGRWANGLYPARPAPCAVAPRATPHVPMVVWTPSAESASASPAQLDAPSATTTCSHTRGGALGIRASEYRAALDLFAACRALKQIGSEQLGLPAAPGRQNSVRSSSWRSRFRREARAGLVEALAQRPPTPSPVMRCRNSRRCRARRASRAGAPSRVRRTAAGSGAPASPWKIGFTSQGRRSTMEKALFAPASAAASSTLQLGLVDERNHRRDAHAHQRRPQPACGWCAGGNAAAEPRGSDARQRGSTVRGRTPRRASARPSVPIRSRSRSADGDQQGTPAFSQHLDHARVMRSRRSIGW